MPLHVLPTGKINSDVENLPPKSTSGGSTLEVLDEGSSLDTAVTSIDFVGTGVQATNTGHAVTVTIPGNGYPGSIWSFGDGADGNAVFDGVNTFGFAALTGGGTIYTLTRSVALNDAQVDSGITVKSGGIALFVNGTLTNNGTVGSPGGNGSSLGTGGGAGNSANFYGGSVGGGNASGVAGTAGSSIASNGYGGAGGAGGAGGFAAGAGGNVTRPNATLGGIQNAYNFDLVMRAVLPGGNTTFQGGAGGGGGGGNGGSGGAGGGGGGVAGIMARNIAGTGVFSCKGGDGFSPTAGTNVGGGGGGGGGWLCIVTTTSDFLNTATMTAAGGTAGTGRAGGANGTNGSAGISFALYV